jgi:hypothetical protein
MGNTGSRGFQEGVVSKKEMERMQRRWGLHGADETSPDTGMIAVATDI